MNRGWLLLFAFSLGVACDSTPAARVLAPKPGGEATLAPVTLKVDFVESFAGGALQVLLNGHDVSSAFAFAAPVNGRIVATATQVWGPGFVLAGTNQLSMSIELAPGRSGASATFQAVGDPYADSVVAFVPGTGAGYGASLLPGVVIGAPNGAGLFQGALTTLALGYGGRLDLAFGNNVIVDGPGVDLTVFENAFLRLNTGFVTGVPFADPARVSVSQDGSTWYAFPCTLDPAAGPYFPGCAGVYPVFANAADPNAPHASIPTTTPVSSLVGLNALTLLPPFGAGGDSFDLATVGLTWARYLRIESASFSTGPVGPDNAGADVDAAVAVNAAPATDANANGIPDAVE